MFVATIKSLWLEALIVVLLLAVSVSIGYEIGKTQQSDDSLPRSAELSNLSQTDNAVVSRIDSINSGGATPALNTETEVLNDSNPELLVVYGSVNGSKYYNYGCKSGNRIKIENRIYFASESEALLAGYEPSVNCDF